MATDEQAQDANYAATTQAQNKVVAIEVALAKLQKVACGLIYERVFNRGSVKPGITTAIRSPRSVLRLSWRGGLLV